MYFCINIHLPLDMFVVLMYNIRISYKDDSRRRQKKKRKEKIVKKGKNEKKMTKINNEQYDNI